MDRTNEELMENPLVRAAIPVEEASSAQLISALESPQQIVLFGGDKDSGRWQDTDTCDVELQLFSGSSTTMLYGADSAPFCGKA